MLSSVSISMIVLPCLCLRQRSAAKCIARRAIRNQVTPFSSQEILLLSWPKSVPMMGLKASVMEMLPCSTTCFASQ